MELLINGNYENVGYWSLMKCQFLVHIGLIALVYGIILFIVMLYYAI